MASIMAKTEFHNLRILDYYGVNVPKPLEYNKGLAFSMEMIPFRNGDSEIKIPAPILKNINLYNIMDDPINFLEDSLDQIELMWKKALMCHGDLSEFNILVSDEKPFIIDVSQSRLYNVNTFSATPVRIRIDNALSIFVRDLKTIINHFEVKYKAYIEIDDVYEKMFNELPDFVREKNILETYDSIHNKSSKLIFMKDNEINTFTNMTLRGKDKKMLNLMRSLSSE